MDVNVKQMFNVGRRVRHLLNPEHYGIGEICEIVTSRYRTVSWDGGAHTTKLMHVGHLTPLCAECGQGAAEHTDMQGKCLFGAGCWR